MELNLKIGGFGLAVLLAVAGSAFYLTPRLNPEVETTTTVVADEVPVVMRTSGGLLEVATIRAHERFTREDAKEFWGIDLGKTVSHIQGPAFYRYHIELAPEWIVTIKDKTCFVVAPPIKPSLPVAFDTTSLQKYTSNGWARFNKNENLAVLERSITPLLAQRAVAPNYLRLATEPARETVKEFVTKWLVKEQHWKRDPTYTVQVAFHGEQGVKNTGSK
jgi:hypothetical protein